MPCGAYAGSVVATIRWSNEPRACSEIHSHSSSSTMSRCPSARTRAARESITKQARASEVAVVRPPARGRLAIAHARERSKPQPGVLVALHLREHLLLGELGWRQVAEMLVQPVRHERARDPFVPPGKRAHLVDPRLRDVPVVAHLVVVEDHRRRHGREQPADVGIGPRLAEEPRVLLEVGDRFAGWVVRAAARLDERRGLRRDLVGVDLVAEKQQAVGPRRIAGLKLPRVGPECVDAEALRIVGRRERVRRSLRRPDPARAEDEPRLALSLPHVDRRLGPAVPRRPDRSAVQSNLVGIDRSRLEVFEHHERVVMTEHMEGASLLPENLRRPPAHRSRPRRWRSSCPHSEEADRRRDSTLRRAPRAALAYAASRSVGPATFVERCRPEKPSRCHAGSEVGS